MESKINPYRPAPIAPRFGSDLQVLTFDGVIGESDYIALLPNQVLMVWLLWVLSVLLVPVALMFAGFGAFLIATTGIGRQTMSLIGGSVFVAGVCAVLFRTASVRYRGRRHLRQNQDLVGTARGSLSASGLLFFDGVCSHWFSPAWLVSADVSTKGIRVPIATDPYRYLALTTQLFDEFSVDAVENLKHQWKQVAEIASSDQWLEHPFGGPTTAPWKPEDDPMPAPIQFSGTLTTQQPMKTLEIKKNATAQTISASVSAVGIFVSWLSDSPWLVVLCLVFVLYGGLTAIIIWRQYFRGIQTITWNQAGWLSENSLVWRSDMQGVNLPIDQICSASMTEEIATLISQSGSMFMIPREQIADDSDWQRLCQKIKATGAGNQSKGLGVCRDKTGLE